MYYMYTIQVLVEYVDYGNEEEVDNTCLRPKLDTALFSLPPQVHYFTLCCKRNIHMLYAVYCVCFTDSQVHHGRNS